MNLQYRVESASFATRALAIAYACFIAEDELRNVVIRKGDNNLFTAIAVIGPPTGAILVQRESQP